jgi:hypothetical protein
MLPIRMDLERQGISYILTTSLLETHEESTWVAADAQVHVLGRASTLESKLATRWCGTS